MEYTTQMDAAQKGIVTQQMRDVTEREYIGLDQLMDLVARGKVAIPANRKHTNIKGCAVGERMSTKINVNLGISKDASSMDDEILKYRKAIEMGGDAIMDLSCFGKTKTFRKKLLAECNVPIGTVPMYDAVGFLEKGLSHIKPREFLEVFRAHAEDGVDFMTIHAGLNRKTVERFKANRRLTNIVSRGGSLIFAWMISTGNENPFYEYFDEVLDIAERYDVTLSLGDAMRPGCIEDASDACQIGELMELGELTLRAWDHNVQVMVEGPGHMPIDQIAANMLLEKRLCHGAPFYVLGPLVTDVAPGYDHITAAIGGAVAAANGADFLCYVTPAEHLRLPDLNDMKEGIVAAKIAAHAGDIAKGIPGAMAWDHRMSEARRNIDWKTMFAEAIDPEKPKAYRESSPPEHEDTCTMCGEMCAMRTMRRAMEGEKEF